MTKRTPTDNDRAREARWNPPDPARADNDVLILTTERDRYRAALQQIGGNPLVIRDGRAAHRIAVVALTDLDVEDNDMSGKTGVPERTPADQLEDIEQTLLRAYANVRQLSAQRARYRQTLERIVAEGVPGSAWNIARNALED